MYLMFVTQENWTPLLTAARNDHAAVIETLVKSGANVNASNLVRMSTMAYWILGLKQIVNLLSRYPGLHGYPMDSDTIKLFCVLITSYF